MLDLWCATDALFINGGYVRFGERVVVKESRHILKLIDNGVLSREPAVRQYNKAVPEVVTETVPAPPKKVPAARRRSSRGSSTRKKSAESSGVRKSATPVSEGLSGAESSD